jgi:parvulin-like peptidyl-prolyl isomerase
MSEAPSEALPALESPPLAQLSRHGLLKPFIERQVVAKYVASIAINEEESGTLIGQFCKRQQLQDVESLDNWLSEQALTREDLAWQLSLPTRIERYARQQFGAKAESRFLQRKTQLDQVVYSLLRVKDGGLARELFLRIQNGEATFADLAARYAEGPEQSTHGIVGPVPLTQAHPVLAEKLRTNPVGSLIQPFSIEQWWLVVRPERLQAACFDEAMALQMSRELFEEWVAEEVALKLRELKYSSGALPNR